MPDSALERLNQEDHEFKINLSYTATPRLKKELLNLKQEKELGLTVGANPGAAEPALQIFTFSFVFQTSGIKFK
jgi:hypothetical protein